MHKSKTYSSQSVIKSQLVKITILFHSNFPSIRFLFMLDVLEHFQDPAKEKLRWGYMQFNFYKIHVCGPKSLMSIGRLLQACLV